MANTYTSLFYHLIFSTKNRVAWIRPEIEQRLWQYLGGIARHHRLVALQIGGTEDHLHALVMAPTTLAPSQIAQYLKGDSSKWIHEEFSEMRDFAWQQGYGALSANPMCRRCGRTFRTSASIIRNEAFRKSISNFCSGTALITMSNMCGADSIVATRRGGFDDAWRRP